MHVMQEWGGGGGGGGGGGERGRVPIFFFLKGKNVGVGVKERC